MQNLNKETRKEIKELVNLRPFEGRRDTIKK